MCVYGHMYMINLTSFTPSVFRKPMSISDIYPVTTSCSSSDMCCQLLDILVVISNDSANYTTMILYIKFKTDQLFYFIVISEIRAKTSI